MVKVCIVGPKCGGKTVVARVLAGWPPDSGCKYVPTAGVRIQELRKEATRRVAVELWDCSGDDKFQACHPAMVNNTKGLILVYNVTAPKQKEELEKWYQKFAVSRKLPSAACHIVGVNLGQDNPKPTSFEGRLGSIAHSLFSVNDPQSQELLNKVLDRVLHALTSLKE